MRHSHTIKKQDEIEKMRVAGKLAAEVLTMIEPYVVPGVSTQELNDICHKYITEVQQAIPAPLNYKGFPKSICTSVNRVVCHGIPSDTAILKKGDIINIDVTVIKDGYHGDNSKMYFVGKPSIKANRLVRVTQECLYKAIELVKPGLNISEIGKVIQAHAHKHNYSVVKEYCGHGIGLNFHEDPQILHYYNPEESDFVLPEGLTFTIEPMINEGLCETKLKSDGWTVVTRDNSLSAQWEHTILVTNNGYEVLTKREEEVNLL